MTLSGCCAECEGRGRIGLGGFFAEVLNVVGAATVGVPLGTVAESQAQAAYGKITQTPDQIAQTVAPKVADAIAHPAKAGTITPISQNIAQSVAPQVAQAMAASGYQFAPGSLGASLVHPDPFGAFGGNSSQLVKYGFVGIGALLLLKALKS